MAIWEKVVVNLEVGAKKIAATASILAERVKAELSIVRLRIRLDEIQSRINELHRIIGRRIVDLSSRSAIPKAGEQLLKDEDIAAALAELEARKKDLEELNAEIKSEQNAFRAEPEQKEETIV
jgi:archaellum component FlaC